MKFHHRKRSKKKSHTFWSCTEDAQKKPTLNNTFLVQIWIEETQVSLGHVLDIFKYTLVFGQCKYSTNTDIG